MSITDLYKNELQIYVAQTMKETERIYFFSIQKNNEIILEFLSDKGKKYRCESVM